MLPTRQGSFRLFRFAGIDVHLHWSWLVVAMYEISTREREYSSPIWNVLEYVALFAIVLLHEFGHALACRQVGGEANQIVLWPLGGVAYVKPPERPGAMLWSIAAGPLVNVVLVPILAVAGYLFNASGQADTMPDTAAWLHAMAVINLGLLVFNLLPIYPTDGGQILRSLLWFPLGRARSLLIATSVGFLGIAGLVGLAVWQQSMWLGLVAFFLGSNCWRGFQQAQALQKLSKLPRRPGFACPVCHAEPLLGEFWQCRNCNQRFDTFATGATCPQCGSHYEETTCVDCGSKSPFTSWAANPSNPPPPTLP